MLMLYNPFYNFELKLKKEITGFKLIKYQSSYTAKNGCFFYQLFFRLIKNKILSNLR